MSKPQLNINVDGVMLVGLGIGVPLLGFLGYKFFTAKDELINSVNPVSQDNLANKTFESIGAALTGDPNWSAGGWAFDWTHNVDGSFRPEAGIDIVNLIPGGGSAIATVWEGAKATANYVSSPNNVVNTSVKKAVGEQNYITASDRIFGLIDLINPLNKSDAYAEKVWGIQK